jgi:hypothetical protein
VADELELEPLVEPDAAPEAEPEGCALDELEGEALDEDEPLGCWVVEPEAAEPPFEEPDDGAAEEDDEAPPLALSFFWMSIEVDEELEPEGAALEPEGELVVPAAELDDEPGAVLGDAVEPAGAVVVLDELAAPGARELLLSPQAVSAAAPNVRETAIARVESFMWPPWLGYWKEAARIGPPLLSGHPAA